MREFRDYWMFSLSDVSQVKKKVLFSLLNFCVDVAATFVYYKFVLAKKRW